MQRTDAAHAIDTVIRARRTTKRLVDPSSADRSLLLDDMQRAALMRMLDSAGHAPFHKRAHAIHRTEAMPSPVPWRFHVLERDGCLDLIDWLRAQADAHPDDGWSRAWSSKIPALLAATGALILVTWLPDPFEGDEPQLSMNNIEHIAAAAAATQNLLLLAQASDWESYWSSGGVLRDRAVFEQLGIDRIEQPLGAILLAPAGFPADKSVPGGLHDQRGEPADWVRLIETPERPANG